ncbi:winged helix-turn-helix domain-containing protein [Halosimplex salinum]|uniref:winged helix-turn-helix domain-containing protein n=1 Tax=Halosimplex salinum TaxID=1710538 RepID=UPI0013DD93F9|nr:helix-turn-helix domain-containing protein [Halosimplex salinum]
MSSIDGRMKHSNKSLVYDALSNPRRLRVVRCLKEAGETLALEELAERVTRWEREEDGADDVDVDTVHASLYHVHVPKLSEAGIVRYRKDESKVTLGDSVSFDAIDIFGE